AQELGPDRIGLGRADFQAQNLPPTIGVVSRRSRFFVNTAGTQTGSSIPSPPTLTRHRATHNTQRATRNALINRL
ncbi:MAG: hypothetical protein ACK4L4_12055, partial [Gemmobacter sp.]